MICIYVFQCIAAAENDFSSLAVGVSVGVLLLLFIILTVVVVVAVGVMKRRAMCTFQHVAINGNYEHY